MVRNLILLPDGTEIFSGADAVNAIHRVKLTQRVNEGTQLKLGSVCIGVLEAELLTPAGELHIPIGTELTLYKVDGEGEREQVGLFTVEKALRPSSNRYLVTAYDRASWLDRDLTEWLENLTGWPYTLQEFAHKICAACGLSLIPGELPNGLWQVQQFSAAKVTGKQLMEWVGEAAGRFCRATPAGEVVLDWYTHRDVSVTPGGACYSLLDTLSAADYLTEPINQVLIRRDTRDLGTAYGNGSNSYVVTGNPLLVSDSQQALQEAARVLYGILARVRYTPCTVTVPAEARVQPGDILSVTDRNGREIPVYVMKRTQQGGLDTLECTGSPRRDSGHSSFGIEALQGKVLELELDVDGIQAENRDSAGKLAALQLTVDGLKTKVSGQQSGVSNTIGRLSAVEQTAEGLSLRVKSVYDDGVSRVSTAAGYTFDENGVTIQKSGTEIKTQITEDGMTVYKNGNGVLTANSQGVDAVDLNASTYLSVAGKSRFEKYKGSRVGCFWIGG
ncbi:MAG: hypothetical protein IJ030_03140 [Oscillospiraceae bacterium]|nr:hypothetical protein [Oscillospiraceae bacterium]